MGFLSPQAPSSRQCQSKLPANVPTVRPDISYQITFISNIKLDLPATVDSPRTPDSVDLPSPSPLNFSGTPRKRFNSISGGGVPLSLASQRTNIVAGRRDPLVLVPGSLEEAKNLFSKLPPFPPGRKIFNKMPVKLRQCHGCHGFSDNHEAFPFGADRCRLEHSDRCAGGIVGGKDSKGKDWRPCPPDYLCQVFEEPFEDEYVSDKEQSDDDDDEYVDPGKEKFDGFDKFGGLSLTNTSPSTSSVVCTTNTSSNPTTCQAGTSSSGSRNSTIVTAAHLQPISSTGIPDDSNLNAELAALEALKLERETLEKAKAVEQQQLLSAKRVELMRQMQAEKDRIEQLKATNVLENFRQQSNARPESHEFQSIYNGPNIKNIRKTKGLRSRVENVIDTIRSDVPSLGHRPSAGQPVSVSKATGTRPKTSRGPVDPVMLEFEQFKAWKAGKAALSNEVESESDASPPRATIKRKTTRNKQLACRDPYTDSSSSEDEDQQQLALVYRRDKQGVKYRCYEPVTNVKARVSAVQPNSIKYDWVRDEKTGREYKKAIPSSKPSNNHHVSVRYTDHRRDSNTPETGHRHGQRSPPPISESSQAERFPGIIPLEEREGKPDKKQPTILDWAKNCPVSYAEKLKYDEINLPVWIWAYVSEILSSRTGLSPDMPKGELEARLQHLLCVLQVTLIHSEKTDFNTTGWSIASIYAKRIQQKLDRRLDS